MNLDEILPTKRPDLSTFDNEILKENLLASTPSITISQIYNIAALIGKEFEVIINKYGPYSVFNLMPKVIAVLEELEDFVKHFGTEGREIDVLKSMLCRLECQKSDRDCDNTRHKKELEDIEESWRLEARELLDLIERLQYENTQLKSAVTEKKSSASAQVVLHTTNEPYFKEIQLMIRLKETIDQQKVQLRSLRQQLTQQQVDLDAMQQQATRMAKLNAILKRKYFVGKKQADQLKSDKSDLELQLATKEQIIHQMRDRISHDLSDLNTALSGANDTLSESMISELISPISPPPQLTESQLIECLNVEGKMIVNKHDPHCPHFTVSELKHVLFERNELKSRLIEVEEQLLIYKRAGDEDPPVHGPINKEPFEKVYNLDRTNSAILRLFFNYVIRYS